MRGTSATSLDAVLEATKAQAPGAPELGDELFAVVAVLDSTRSLRRVLTDPSVGPEPKVRLATTVFGSELSDAAQSVVDEAVSGRWSAGRDLADAIEAAGVTAYVAAADAAGESDRVQDELFAFSHLVTGDHELRAVLTDRTYPSEAKATLVRELLDGKASAAGRALAAQAVIARSGNYERTIKSFAKIAADFRSRLVATVRVAAPLSEDLGRRLAASLASKYGHDVHLNVHVDPTVVGGISVTIGDDTIDGSISSRLADARRRIAG